MTRVLTAIPLVALALYLIFWSPQPVFLAAAVAMGWLCYREYSELVAHHGIPKAVWLGACGGIALILAPPQFALTTAVLTALAALMWALRYGDLRDVLPYAASVALGLLYTFLPWRFATYLRGFSVHLLFFALALNWAGDSVAFYVGRTIGRHRLAPVVSPKKSWEGAIASVIGAVVFGLIYLGYFVPAVPKWQVIVIATVANVAGQFGDLAESAMKRGASVKDSGTLLPGHGGMLDRVDSSLFALPVVYVLLLLFARTPNSWRTHSCVPSIGTTYRGRSLRAMSEAIGALTGRQSSR